VPFLSTNGSTRKSIESGVLTLQPDPAAAGNADWRTHARKGSMRSSADPKARAPRTSNR